MVWSILFCYISLSFSYHLGLAIFLLLSFTLSCSPGIRARTENSAQTKLTGSNAIGEAFWEGVHERHIKLHFLVNCIMTASLWFNCAVRVLCAHGLQSAQEHQANGRIEAPGYLLEAIVPISVRQKARVDRRSGHNKFVKSARRAGSRNR